MTSHTLGRRNAALVQSTELDLSSPMPGFPIQPRRTVVLYSVKKVPARGCRFFLSLWFLDEAQDITRTLGCPHSSRRTAPSPLPMTGNHPWQDLRAIAIHRRSIRRRARDSDQASSLGSTTQSSNFRGIEPASTGHSSPISPTSNRLAWTGESSDPQEYLTPVHPEQDQPEHQQHGCAVEQGLVGRAQDLERSLPR